MGLSKKEVLGIVIAVFIIIAVGFPIVSYLFHTGSFTKYYGGSSTIDIPAGQKLVPYTVQWEPKNANIWYLTEPAEDGYEPRQYLFNESSNLGIMQGTIIFQEHK